MYSLLILVSGTIHKRKEQLKRRFRGLKFHLELEEFQAALEKIFGDGVRCNEISITINIF